MRIHENISKDVLGEEKTPFFPPDADLTYGSHDVVFDFFLRGVRLFLSRFVFAWK